MFISLKQAGEAIAKMAENAGIQSEGGKLLTISEGFLAFILVVVVNLFSVEYVILFAIYSFAVRHQRAPHSYAWDAFLVCIVLVSASLLFVFVREFAIRPPSPRA